MNLAAVVPNAIVATSAMLLLQVVPPLADVVSPVERITFLGALIVAVRVLWVSNTTKDAQVVAMASDVTKTMALVMESVKELRKTTEEIGAALDNLASNIAAIPCKFDLQEAPDSPVRIVRRET